MDGIATLVTGLVLVIVLNIAFVNRSEHRKSAIELLTNDVKEVAQSAQAVHDYIGGLRGDGEQRDLSVSDQRKLLSLSQEYSNSLTVVDHSLGLCGFDVDAAFKECERDRERYNQLILGDAFPMKIESEAFRAESGEHTNIQKNLRTLLYAIGQGGMTAAMRRDEKKKA